MKGARIIYWHTVILLKLKYKLSQIKEIYFRKLHVDVNKIKMMKSAIQEIFEWYFSKVALTLKAPSKITADETFIIFTFIFQENKA